jgi:hypothetical protein
MDHAEKLEKDQRLAQRCVECTVCRSAREKQRGLSYWFVKNIESVGICPWCSAYERVYGRKPHEPAPMFNRV